MRTIAITGAASGIGRATREILEVRGDRVIGVDRTPGQEVTADLANESGRRAAIDGLSEASGERLDAYLGFAGLPAGSRAGEAIVSVNYFASVALLEGLRPLLANGSNPAAVAVASVSALMGKPAPALVDAMLAGDETAAREIAGENWRAAYTSSKNALARRARALAVEWIRDGIRLNTLAPGFTASPLTDIDLADPDLGPVMAGTEIPIGRWAEPSDIAEVAAWLVSTEARYVVGSTIVADGGLVARRLPDTL